ncbi:DUF4333 domain-containing protein [Amycolatopsis sp. FDAARGOS 1241]|uniref:DUF4333 domain-containing protein n=1 Tax=Amycolatopsis sp. FDAARGOS 1241 TaxID=2778070 RepID=UPI001951E1A0|nr:DUF4333 domain-containing protein [Amycolatopsis sp. FDAARGOS 1241]QRP45354.1 DUF4333 domain-containing protein [Amycolatopsis sp. FDAARGOS 1241]
MTQPPEQPQQWPPPSGHGTRPGNTGAWEAGGRQYRPQQNGQPPVTPTPDAGGQPYPGAPHTGPQPYPAQPYTGPQAQPYASQHVPGGAPQHRNPPYGGGFQPSAYGGLGAFSAEAVKKAPKSRRPWVIGGAVVVVVVIGAGAAWLFGAFRGDTLDRKSLQDGVARVLAENYGEPDAKNVVCPSGEPAVNGTTFDCTVQLGGHTRKVTVRVLNDKPEYAVGAPR